MSVIQTIREKAAVLVIVLIGLSLVGFILMDAGRAGMGGGVTPGDPIGIINGKKYTYEQFLDKTKETEQRFQMSGRMVDENARQEINMQTWQQMIEEAVLDEDIERLGIEVTDKEYNDMLFGSNPPDWLRQQFTNPQTGEYDALAARQAIAELKKTTNNPNREMLNNMYLKPMLENRKRQKYFGMLQNSAYVPKWLAEKTIADNEQIAAFDFVTVPYSSIVDTTIKVTDAQIMEYANKNKSDFETLENSRSISYVAFPFTANAEDSAAILEEINRLKPEFETTADPGQFVMQHGTEMPFYDGFLSRDRIQIAQKDSILSTSGVFGPYLDGNTYVLSRVIGTRNMPDSVRASHILIPVGGQQGIDDATAKRMIDSLEALIKTGASFEELARQNSADPGSAERGGDLGYFAGGQMVKEFNDFSFDHKTGEMGIVRTQFGYHLIKVTDQKNFGTGYKVAYLALPIESSQATISDAQSKANIFSGNSRTPKAYQDNITKNGYNKMIAADVKETDHNVQGLGASRALVKEIFSAKVGEVLEPEQVGDQYVVVLVEGEQKKGMPSANRIRPMVETIVRNEIKGKQIAEKMKGATDLASLSQKVGQPVQSADSVLFASPLLPGAGYEMKVGGYAFNKAALNKVSQPITGGQGVYVVQVKSVTKNAAAAPVSVEDMQAQLLNQVRTDLGYGTIEALRKAAKIEDRRTKFL